MNRQQDKMQMFNKMWEMKAVKRRPVYSLKACLQGYGDKMLQELERTLEIENCSKEEDKSERLKRLAFAIQEDMKQQMSYLTRRQAYFLGECAQKPHVETVSGAYGLDTIFSLVDVGWVYWFMVGETTSFVLPTELQEIVKEAFYIKDTFFEQQKYYELSEYIEAFVNLYGAFEMSHLLTVWNQHHLEDLFTLEELEIYVRKVNGRQSVFETNGEFIYAANDLDETTAKNVMKSVAELPYYFPSPNEMWSLAYKNIQEKILF